MSASSESGASSPSPSFAWLALIAIATYFGLGRPAGEQSPAPPASVVTTQAPQSSTAPSLAQSTHVLACGSDALGNLGWFFGVCEPGQIDEKGKVALRLKLQSAVVEAMAKAEMTDLKFVVFTLPDPHFRALGTLTDSFLDAYALGLGDLGFVPFSTGPAEWPAVRVPSGSTSAQRKPSHPPGVWIFSKKQEGLAGQIVLTLVAGENPVSGADQSQLKSALAQIEDLRSTLPARNTEELFIGPTFSGSARSVATAINDSPITYALKGASGTASNANVENILHSEKLIWWTNTILEPVCLAIKDIRKAFGPKEKIMLLAEGNTAYGRDSACKNEELERAQLPGDLAVLRKAYSENKNLYFRIFPSAKDGPTSLPIPLHTSSGEGMTVYSGETLAKSQETALSTFAHRLKAEHIDFLGIVTTDRLDSLFLARFFRQHSPNVQIFLVGSDALFNAENARGLLSGVFTYSTSPIGITTPYKDLAPNDLAARLRTTTYHLISNGGAPGKALFASVIGRGGEWPLRIVTEFKFQRWEAVGNPGAAIGFFLALIGILGIPVLRSVSTLFAAGRSNWISTRLRSICPYAHWVPNVWKAESHDSSAQGREVKRLRWLVGYAAVWLLILIGLSLFSCFAFLGDSSVLKSRYRSLLNGVNPVIPMLCFSLIVMAFAWMRIRARYLDNYTFHVLPAQRIVLPSEIKSDLIHANQEGFCLRWGWVALGVGLFMGACYDLFPRDIAPFWYGGNHILWLILGLTCYAIVICSLIHFWRLWRLLARLLSALEAHPIRNAFTRLPERVSWTSVWSFSGFTPSFVSLQLATDYLSVLRAPDINLNGETISKLFSTSCDFLVHAKIGMLPDGRLDPAQSPQISADLHFVMRKSRQLAGRINRTLVPLWNQSALEGWRGAKLDWARHSASKEFYELGNITKLRNPYLEKKWGEHLKLGEEYIATLFCSYIRYVFLQLRNLAGSITISASLLFLAFSSYPFQPHGALMNSITFLFVFLAIVFVVVFQQMDRDPILSRLSDTSAGKLDAGFATRLLQFGLLPSLTFLAGQVPGMSDLLLRIVEVIPGLPK